MAMKIIQTLGSGEKRPLSAHAPSPRGSTSTLRHGDQKWASTRRVVSSACARITTPSTRTPGSSSATRICASTAPAGAATGTSNTGRMRGRRASTRSDGASGGIGELTGEARAPSSGGEHVCAANRCDDGCGAVASLDVSARGP